MNKESIIKKFGPAALVIIVVCAAAEIMALAGWLEMPEAVYYDLWHQLAGKRYQPEHVVLIDVDEQTRLEHQHEPLVFWGPHFARAIEVLNKVGAASVGLDYLFLVSAESWLKSLNPKNPKSRIYDADFRRQLHSEKVILAGKIGKEDQKNDNVLLPLRNYVLALQEGAEGIGLVDIFPDHDNVTRRFVPLITDAEGTLLGYMFAQLLADKKTGQAHPTSTSQPQYISFAGPPDTFLRISFGSLLQGGAETNAEIQKLKGKVVIIGLVTTDYKDTHLTPYARSFFLSEQQRMSGSELHANIVESILTNRLPRPVGMPLGLIYLVVLVSLATILFLRLNPWQGFPAALVFCLFAVLLGYLFFSHSIILPVANIQLALGMSYIATGALKFTSEERHRKHLERQFGCRVPPEVLKKILNRGRDVNLAGEMATITILFADIRKFTTISEQITPQEVVAMLNAYFDSICTAIFEWEGTIDKYLGDGIMAMFGAPNKCPDHAYRALRAALAMLEKARAFRDEWMQGRFSDKTLPEFNIGVGVHSGKVVVGDIGCPQLLDYTAVGDPVNLASRLEAVTKELGWSIVASKETIEMAGSGFITPRRDNIFIRGRHEKVEVFEVTGWSEPVMRTGNV